VFASLVVEAVVGSADVEAARPCVIAPPEALVLGNDEGPDHPFPISA
jgi:hypothetical protein